MFSFLFRYSFQKRMDNFNYNCHKWKGVKTQRIERKKNYEKKKSQKKMIRPLAIVLLILDTNTFLFVRLINTRPSVIIVQPNKTPPPPPPPSLNTHTQNYRQSYL